MPTVNIMGAKMVLRLLRATRFKKPYTVATPPPWSKVRNYLAGRTPNQVKVNNAFAAAASATAEMALADRMKAIGDGMRGANFGGVKRRIYPRLSPEALKTKVAAVKSAIAAI